MAVTIQGVRITNIHISRNDKGEEEVQGTYELVSNNDKVLAKQDFNSYNSIKIDLSLETKQALQSFLTGVKRDTLIVLGLTE